MFSCNKGKEMGIKLFSQWNRFMITRWKIIIRLFHSLGGHISYLPVKSKLITNSFVYGSWKPINIKTGIKKGVETQVCNLEKILMWLEYCGNWWHNDSPQFGITFWNTSVICFSEYLGLSWVIYHFLLSSRLGKYLKQGLLKMIFLLFKIYKPVCNLPQLSNLICLHVPRETKLSEPLDWLAITLIFVSVQQDEQTFLLILSYLIVYWKCWKNQQSVIICSFSYVYFCEDAFFSCE